MPQHKEPCPKTWMGKSCIHKAGHLGPCQYTAG